ncbi:hypothetical protein DFH06DRAFT_1131864 [Mycena polygramma]|nr:hypothetical protein DFH06DRAFT_1131864 [Mycena polygramma]
MDSASRFDMDDDYDDMPVLMDVSDSESDTASDCASDDDVPELVSVEDVERRNADDCRTASSGQRNSEIWQDTSRRRELGHQYSKRGADIMNRPYADLKAPAFTYKIPMAYDANFRLRRATGTPAVLMLACPACDIGRPGISEHEGNVFRRSEQPTGEYLEWEACAPRVERARTLAKATRYREEVEIFGEEMLRALHVEAGWGRTDGEGPERMWALSTPLPLSTRAIVPAFVRAKL